jgi:hypothetical protein
MEKIEYKKGMCPKCASGNIDYMEHDYNDHYLSITAVCCNCETRINEQYNLVFIGASFYQGINEIEYINQGEKINLNIKEKGSK